MKSLLTVIALFFGLTVCRSADIQKIVADTQRVSQGPSNVTMVWWIPSEFWEATLKDNPRVTTLQRKEFIKALDGYLIFAVASLDIGALGGMAPKSRADILQQTELIIGDKKCDPLADADISADASNFMSIMKPMMANMLGQFGQGIEFILYSNNGDSAPRIQGEKEGAFSYIAFGTRYDWKLPLGSLLPNKFDIKTKQSFPGDYNFNPYTGDKLTTK